jgi:hypothetical protein
VHWWLPGQFLSVRFRRQLVLSECCNGDPVHLAVTQAIPIGYKQDQAAPLDVPATSFRYHVPCRDSASNRRAMHMYMHHQPTHHQATPTLARIQGLQIIHDAVILISGQHIPHDVCFPHDAHKGLEHLVSIHHIIMFADVIMQLFNTRIVK